MSGNVPGPSQHHQIPNFLRTLHIFQQVFSGFFPGFIRVFSGFLKNLEKTWFNFHRPPPWPTPFGGPRVNTDLFSRKFREGISFPNFAERCIPELPLSKLCSVPFSLQNKALFEGKKRAKRCREKGRRRGFANRKGKKEKRTRENRSVYQSYAQIRVRGGLYCAFSVIRDNRIGRHSLPICILSSTPVGTRTADNPSH